MTNFFNLDTETLARMYLVATLVPKTAKAKQRIKQWGNRGRVVRVVESIPASTDDGPFFAVAAGDPTFRWVNARDKDFGLVLEPWPVVEVMPKWKKWSEERNGK